MSEEMSRAERLRMRNENDLRMMLSTPNGRRFLGNLIFDPASLLGGGTGVNHATFSQSHATMAAAEGARDVGLRLLACIEALDFSAALQIRRERYDEADAEVVQERLRESEVPPESFGIPVHEGPVG